MRPRLAVPCRTSWWKTKPPPRRHRPAAERECGPRHLPAAGYRPARRVPGAAVRHGKAGLQPGPGRCTVQRHRVQPAGPHHRGGRYQRGLPRGPGQRLPQQGRHAGWSGGQCGRQLYRRQCPAQRGLFTRKQELEELRVKAAKLQKDCLAAQEKTDQCKQQADAFRQS